MKIKYKVIVGIASTLLVISGLCTNYFGLFNESVLTELVSVVIAGLVAIGVVQTDTGARVSSEDVSQDITKTKSEIWKNKSKDETKDNTKDTIILSDKSENK